MTQGDSSSYHPASISHESSPNATRSTWFEEQTPQGSRCLSVEGSSSSLQKADPLKQKYAKRVGPPSKNVTRISIRGVLQGMLHALFEADIKKIDNLQGFANIAVNLGPGSIDISAHERVFDRLFGQLHAWRDQVAFSLNSTFFFFFCLTLTIPRAPRQYSLAATLDYWVLLFDDPCFSKFQCNFAKLTHSKIPFHSVVVCPIPSPFDLLNIQIDHFK